jgi:hypothetical protein
MLCPDRAHLFVGRKFTAGSLPAGFRKGRYVFRCELNDGLILAKKLQQQPRNIILHRWRQSTGGINSMFKQFRHRVSVA